MSINLGSNHTQRRWWAIRDVGAQWQSTSVSLLRHFDRADPNTRLTTAVALSLIGHLTLLWLILMGPAKGMLSIGTTGMGEANGAGNRQALDLIQPIYTASRHPDSLSTLDILTLKQTADTDVQQPEGKPKADKISPNGLTSQSLTEALASDASKTEAHTKAASPSDSAGAYGQNGEAIDDLWAAIAPCWNRVADGGTLGATLKVTFSTTGGLALPPEIERAPGSAVTPDMLSAEAKAISALAECGAYPMAQGRQDIVITFPRAG